MTPAQEEAVYQVRQILNQNFDAWVFTTRETDDNQHDSINSFWGGPFDSIVGLARITSVRLDRRIIESSGSAEPFGKQS